MLDTSACIIRRRNPFALYQVLGNQVCFPPAQLPACSRSRCGTRAACTRGVSLDFPRAAALPVAETAPKEPTLSEMAKLILSEAHNVLPGGSSSNHWTPCPTFTLEAIILRDFAEFLERKKGASAALYKRYMMQNNELKLAVIEAYRKACTARQSTSAVVDEESTAPFVDGEQVSKASATLVSASAVLDKSPLRPGAIEFVPQNTHERIFGSRIEDECAKSNAFSWPAQDGQAVPGITQPQAPAASFLEHPTTTQKLAFNPTMSVGASPAQKPIAAMSSPPLSAAPLSADAKAFTPKSKLTDCQQFPSPSGALPCQPVEVTSLFRPAVNTHEEHHANPFESQVLNIPLPHVSSNPRASQQTRLPSSRKRSAVWSPMGEQNSQRPRLDDDLPGQFDRQTWVEQKLSAGMAVLSRKLCMECRKTFITHHFLKTNTIQSYILIGDGEETIEDWISQFVKFVGVVICHTKIEESELSFVDGLVESMNRTLCLPMEDFCSKPDQVKMLGLYHAIAMHMNSGTFCQQV